MLNNAQKQSVFEFDAFTDLGFDADKRVSSP
jgi:hypothetical protein